MKKKLTINIITEVAILTAIAFALDLLEGSLWRGIFINGGAIGIAMVPILILSYRRGFLAGLISGIILSLLQMLGGIYAIADTWYKVFFQIFLDYIIAYPCVAFAGLFYAKFQNANENKAKVKWVIIGSTIGGLLKLFCHFLSGIIFWKNFDFPGGPELYSLFYNSGYMIPSIIISIVIVCILVCKQPTIFKVMKEESDENEK